MKTKAHYKRTAAKLQRYLDREEANAKLETERAAHPFDGHPSPPINFTGTPGCFLLLPP